METRKEDPQPNEPRKEPKPGQRRFQLIKLEERIAPSRGHTNGYCHTQVTCFGTCTC
jgi:hypothetical protein